MQLLTLDDKEKTSTFGVYGLTLCIKISKLWSSKATFWAFWFKLSQKACYFTYHVLCVVEH